MPDVLDQFIIKLSVLTLVRLNFARNRIQISVLVLQIILGGFAEQLTQSINQCLCATLKK